MLFLVVIPDLAAIPHHSLIKVHPKKAHSIAQLSAHPEDHTFAYKNADSIQNLGNGSKGIIDKRSRSNPNPPHHLIANNAIHASLQNDHTPEDE